MHGVSFMTARHALARLEREGLVERRAALEHSSRPRRFSGLLSPSARDAAISGASSTNRFTLNGLLPQEIEARDDEYQGNKRPVRMRFDCMS
jgi:DNA-binding transcriptional MocR family regulator